MMRKSHQNNHKMLTLDELFFKSVTHFQKKISSHMLTPRQALLLAHRTMPQPFSSRYACARKKIPGFFAPLQYASSPEDFEEFARSVRARLSCVKDTVKASDSLYAHIVGDHIGQSTSSSCIYAGGIQQGLHILVFEMFAVL